MLHNQKTNRYPIYNKKLVIIYPIPSRKQRLDHDFYLQLSSLKLNKIKYIWLNLDLSTVTNDYISKFSEQFKNDLIYLYIPDITLLYKTSNLLGRLKKNNSFVIMGGSSAMTVKASEILNLFEAIDVIVRSPDEEKVLVGLLNGMSEEKELESLKGITFRQRGTNKIIRIESPPLSEDLDDLYDRHHEFLEQKMINREWYPLLTSRGCNHNCRYCTFQVPYRMNHKSRTNYWRPRSAKKIIDEMEELIARGIDKFIFFSQQFFNPEEASGPRARGPSPYGHVSTIAREVLKRKLKPELTCIAKASELLKNFDTLSILTEAGLGMINIGIDSGLERFHRMYETGSSVQDGIEVLKRIHEHNFNFKFTINFIFFDPYLSIDELEENLKFLESISVYFSHLPNPYSVYLHDVLKSVLNLHYGMPILEKLKEDNLLIEFPDFSAVPQFKFKDPGVGKIYSIYKSIVKNLLPSFKSRIESNESVKKNPCLNLFPLNVMKKIVSDVIDDRVTSIPKYVFDMAAYFKNATASAKERSH